MQMEIFAEMVRTELEKELGDGFNVGIQDVIKNNGVCLKGLWVRETGRDASPTIYLESFLEAYEKGYPLSELVNKLLQAYLENRVEGTVDLEFFRDFSMVRDRVCYRLVGRKGNEAFLKGIPHIEFLDLAACFYYAYSDEVVGEGSILINNSHMEMWGACLADLFLLAQANTPRLFPWRFGSLAEILAGRAEAGEGEAPCAPGAPVFDDIPMKVLTNSKKAYGAACILYPGILEEVSQKMGGDFFVIPSSVHEAVLLPYGGMLPAGEIKEMIFDINRTQVAPEEVLSDSLYHYDAEKKVLVLA